MTFGELHVRIATAAGAMGDCSVYTARNDSVSAVVQECTLHQGMHNKHNLGVHDGVKGGSATQNAAAVLILFEPEAAQSTSRSPSTGRQHLHTSTNNSDTRQYGGVACSHWYSNAVRTLYPHRVRSVALNTRQS